MTPEGGEETFPQEVLDFLLVMRCLRLVRIVANVQQFRIIIMTIMNIAPSLLTYGVVLIVSKVNWFEIYLNPLQGLVNWMFQFIQLIMVVLPSL